MKCCDCDFCRVTLTLHGGEILYTNTTKGLNLRCDKGWWHDHKGFEKRLRPNSLAIVNKILKHKKYCSEHWGCGETENEMV